MKQFLFISVPCHTIICFSLILSCFTSVDEDEFVPKTVTKIELAPTEASIREGEEKSFTATIYDQTNKKMEGITLTWSSSLETVATVSSTGMASGISNGEAMIKASFENVTGSAKLVVMAEPVVTSVVVSPESTKASRGERETFTAKVYDQYDNEMFGYEVDWESNHPCVASIDESGKLAAISRGETNIYATVEGVSGSAVIEVDGVVNEENAILQGDWMVCQNYKIDGEYMYNLSLEHEIGEEGIKGKVTRVRTGSQFQLYEPSSKYYNANRFSFVWFERVAGQNETFHISWEENINEDMFQGAHFHWVHATSYQVRVVRKLPDE